MPLQRWRSAGHEWQRQFGQRQRIERNGGFSLFFKNFGKKSWERYFENNCVITRKNSNFSKTEDMLTGKYGLPSKNGVLLWTFPPSTSTEGETLKDMGVGYPRL